MPPRTSCPTREGARTPQSAGVGVLDSEAKRAVQPSGQRIPPRRDPLVTERSELPDLLEHVVVLLTPGPPLGEGVSDPESPGTGSVGTSGAGVPALCPFSVSSKCVEKFLCILIRDCFLSVQSIRTVVHCPFLPPYEGMKSPEARSPAPSQQRSERNVRSLLHLLEGIPQLQPRPTPRRCQCRSSVSCGQTEERVHPLSPSRRSNSHTPPANTVPRLAIRTLYGPL